MKKFMTLFFAVLITSIFVVGCSNTAPQSNNEPAISDENIPDNATRIVSTVMGDIEVPANPERVVVNWYIGDVFALRLNVVGHNAWDQETMPFYDKFASSTKIENWEPEDVMALNPDLIVTYNEEDFEKFKKIAPVLVIPESGISSLERIQLLGDATGKSAEAEAAIKAFETKLADAKKILNSDAFNGKTFSIMEDWGASGEWSGIYYETGSRGGTLVYEYLKLDYPDKLKKLIEESGAGRGHLSYEVAHEYFGDYILWCRQEGKESEYAKTDLWKSIPAVAEGRLVEIPGKYQGLFFYSDVTSLTAQLDYMVNALNSLTK
ncbi:ABC transporter substrate-binding protein [Alkaliphilus sp. MSJ-5]|uniref:ABC transporter substrate-binding protein n=1 Tax=Alkaliphilus flagellatus TaxID=2841507 RepID=A0ABS6G0R2_9FIRM|nr:ABC transporter substrate-binding protein [Alkaliphilus flagellatus]MBU5675929.1 ABC transporter substrate-binding protein [Alkaliphilus flagellatus]